MATLRLHRPGEASFELHTGRVQIGRDATADWVVADKSVSRKHAIIEERDGAYWLVDQGSANGSFVNGERTDETKLRDGTEIRLGTVTLRVEIESDIAGTVMMVAPTFEEEGRTVMMAAPEIAPPRAFSGPPPVAPPPVLAPPPVAPPRAADPMGEARALLGVHPGASPEEVHARFEEVSRDLQAKLASARTPTLQATYQRNLDSVAEARRLLAPNLLTEDVLADLPAVQPSVGPDSLDMSDMRGAVADPIQVTADPARSQGAWSAGMTFFIFVSSGLLATFAFFALSTQKINKELAKIASNPEFAKAREEAAQFQTAAKLQKAGILVNGKLRLCNKAAVPLPIRWIGAVRLGKGEMPPDADLELAKEASGYKVETFNSAFCPEVHLTLAPGEEKALDFSSLDGKCKWDGSALFWSLAYDLRTAPPPEAPPPPAAHVTPPKGKKGQAATPAQPSEVFVSGVLNGKDECVALGGGT